MSILLFILILGILIFVHELGHFVVAKFFGIRVDEFGMGFPPRAIKLFSRKGTDYTLNWIPFGGFVKIYGEDSLDKNDPDFSRSLMAKKWWQQILVMIAGVTMNIALAWVLFSGVLMMGAPTPAGQATYPDRLINPQTTILAVQSDSPAARAGLQAGDVITQLESAEESVPVMNTAAFTEFVQQSSGESLTLHITRGTETKIFSITPEIQDSGKRMIGIALDEVGMYRFGFFESLVQGGQTTFRAIGHTVQAFGKMITGKVGIESITGPVGLVGVVGDAQKIGAAYVIILMAMISVNLAVINLVPFPALDGGRILFILIEQIIRRPLPQKFVAWTNGIGFSLLILLMIVITVKDVIGLF